MNYKATYLMMGKKYTGEGATATEAIANIKLKALKVKGVLTMEKGKDKKERVIMPHVAFRLFNTVGLNREVALKNISLMFDGF